MTCTRLAFPSPISYTQEIMVRTEERYLLTLHPDRKAQEAIFALTKHEKSSLIHPLFPFILLQESTSPIPFPLAIPIPTLPKPVTFGMIKHSTLITEDSSFQEWSIEAGISDAGFAIPYTSMLQAPIEIVDWRGRITRLETTTEEGKIVRYRWDILNEFHFA